jgi:hypothetical protein
VRAALVVALAVFLHAFAWGSSAAENAPIELPTEMCRDYFFVPVTLAPKDGYPEDRTLWFLHDTGASSSFVDPDSINRVANIRPKAGTRVNMRDVSIGPLEYSRITARAGELDHLSVALGRRIDGILSFGAFKDFLLTLDYQAGVLRVEKGKLPKPNGVDVFSAKGKDYRPWTTVKFGRKSRRMLIDSGAGTASFVVRRLDKYQTVSEPQVTGVTTGLKSDDIEVRKKARAAQLVLLGAHTLQAPILASTKDTEIIGGGVMKHFVWTFDQSTKRFRMTRSAPGAEIEFAPVTGLGLLYTPSADGLLVRKILEDSPARQLDIKPGDLVTHFDGKPLEQRGCDTQDEGTRTVGFIRDGQFRELNLEIYIQVP